MSMTGTIQTPVGGLSIKLPYKKEDRSSGETVLKQPPIYKNCSMFASDHEGENQLHHKTPEKMVTASIRDVTGRMKESSSLKVLKVKK